MYLCQTWNALEIRQTCDDEHGSVYFSGVEYSCGAITFIFCKRVTGGYSEGEKDGENEEYRVQITRNHGFIRFILRVFYHFIY